MKASNKTMAFADKTTNIYRLTREEYDKILNDSITATYKKANNNINAQKKSMLLINPAKNELGKISKVILDRINKNIRENLQLD